MRIIFSALLLLPIMSKFGRSNNLWFINNNTRSCNIVAGWSKYYFDFKTYKSDTSASTFQ